MRGSVIVGTYTSKFSYSALGFWPRSFQISEHIAICQWLCNECHTQVNGWYGVLALRGNCSFILNSPLWHFFLGRCSLVMSWNVGWKSNWSNRWLLFQKKKITVKYWGPMKFYQGSTFSPYCYGPKSLRIQWTSIIHSSFPK